MRHFNINSPLIRYDEEVGKAMEAELKRQKRNLELIASENIVSPAVMAAMGSVLTNKYAEGYPGKRYYGGCDCVDVVENLAIDRAKELVLKEFRDGKIVNASLERCDVDGWIRV